MIIKCTCKSDYQDKRYGVGMRVMNKRKPDKAYKCTVCSKEVLK